MKYADITGRLSGLGGAKWEIHAMAKAMTSAGQEVLSLTIGEPDVPTPPNLIEKAQTAMAAGRYAYSNGRGEPGLLAALAARYSRRTGRTIGSNQIMAFPGTQTALYAVMMALVQTGDEVLVGDPMYATYEGVIAATGATTVAVPLRAEHGFRLQVEDVAARITPASRVLFLNTPHNPTGAVLSRGDIAALGKLARQHDLWILSDEVYEELIFGDAAFASPLDQADLADRTIVVSSISKSHAAPGFRSGWAVGPGEFTARLLPVAETMLFGNQPFIADMTALAVSHPSSVAPGMAERFARRAGIIRDMLHGQNAINVHQPGAGMFTVIDIRATGLSGHAFARGLLAEEKVAVMPGESFGPALNGWLRLSLTRPDDETAEACRRIAAFAARQMPGAA
ncbi:aminotransferase class I/II-fold pyridoxal phosphate-dependent enzyme [bacterium]|nr:aminotransferase class I/II-fold pyridoxal phosphate-dependent enzyme [bacterium]